MSRAFGLSVPRRTRVDEIVPIRASGLAPDRLATLSVRTQAGGQVWHGIGTFTPDADGTVDPRSAPSLAGTYRGRSAMGLFWSQRCVDGGAVFTASALPSTSTVILRQGANTIARNVIREPLSAAATSRRVRECGLVGTLFHPREHPARPVLVVGGSEGGQNDLVAALLASHGFAALALTYFGADGLPGQLRDVSIDYFRRAIDWLATQPESSSERVAIVGNSKGGEAALLVASLTTRIAAVAAIVPSGVLLSAANERPTWRDGSRNLPSVEHDRHPDVAIPGEAMLLGAAYPQDKGLDRDDDAVIAVERIAGPVLIAAAADDAVWPSELAAVAADRLRRATRRYNDRYVVLRGAGHLVQPPYLPTTPALVPYGAGWMVLGGTPAANAQASVRAWRETLALLRRAWRDGHQDSLERDQMLTSPS